MFALSFEPPKTPNPSRNWCDRAGAYALKAQIEAYWRERGHKIQVMIHEGGYATALRGCRFDIRSDLKNGLPSSPSQLERAA